MYCWERSKLSIDSSQSIPMSMGQCSEPQLANAPMGMRASATRIENARQNMELLLVGADGIAVSARTGRDPWRQAGKRDALGARRRIGGDWNTGMERFRRGRRSSGWARIVCRWGDDCEGSWLRK